MNDSLEWLNNFLSICCSVDLHESSEQLQNVVQILKDRYVNNYRHRYSAIAALLKRSPYSEYLPDQFDMLRSNMEYIEQSFDALGFSDEARESSIKLFDHLILEVDRINNIDRRIEQIQVQEKKTIEALVALREKKYDVSRLLSIVVQLNDTLKSVQSKTNEIELQQQSLSDQYSDFGNNLKKAQCELQHMETRIDGFNTQSITILSIFTAIVFAFTGGFTMLGNAFSNLSGITRNESVLLISIVLIIGCILLDIIYFLLDFIGKMSNIRFSGNCDLNCNNCNKKNGETTCNGWTRFRNRHFLIKCVNIVTIAVIVVMLFINMVVITPLFPGQTNESDFSDLHPSLLSDITYTTTPFVTVEPTITPDATAIVTPPSSDE